MENLTWVMNLTDVSTSLDMTGAIRIANPYMQDIAVAIGYFNIRIQTTKAEFRCDILMVIHRGQDRHCLNLCELLII